MDDDASYLDVMTRLLEKQGYHVQSAASAENALAALEKDRFEAILLDIVLPGMSGLRAIQEIKKRTSAPILIITGHTDDELKKDALLLGAAQFLPKPLEWDKLFACLREILR